MAEELPPPEKECFFIAPIGDSKSQRRERSDGILREIIRPAAQEVGLMAVRGDEINTTGEIDLQVVEHVKKARMAVVDVTEGNTNVGYELALRLVFERPWVQISEGSPPADVAQIRTVPFSRELHEAEASRQRITAAMRANWIRSRSPRCSWPWLFPC
jgi:hypothetical protein